ncbi:hypothetical protein M422DRAFT_205651, partial [Sphaerobolus stellatus SS14]
MMEKGRYCEMWYFTAEGLNAAKKSGAYADSEGDVLITDSSGGMAWIPAVAKRDLGSFKEDRELTWEEFAAAVPRMLLAMQRAHWPEDRMQLLAGFWGNLMSHPLRVSIDPLASRTLLLYQAEQREAWHLALLEGREWDLADISTVLMQKAGDDTYRSQREETDRAMTAKWDFQVKLAVAQASTPKPSATHQRRRSASPPSRSHGTSNPINTVGHSRETKGDFRSGTGQTTTAYPLCAVCLGRHQHDISACCALRSWDGRHAAVAKRQDRKLVLLSGRPLCFRWQGHNGCSSRTH